MYIHFYIVNFNILGTDTAFQYYFIQAFHIVYIFTENLFLFISTLPTVLNKEIKKFCLKSYLYNSNANILEPLQSSKIMVLGASTSCWILVRHCRTIRLVFAWGSRRVHQSEIGHQTARYPLPVAIVISTSRFRHLTELKN